MAKPNIISKEALIQSAKACIVENGLEKLTLQSVAKQANVTQGTVYYHFRTKENLTEEPFLLNFLLLEAGTARFMPCVLSLSKTRSITVRGDQAGHMGISGRFID